MNDRPESIPPGPPRSRWGFGEAVNLATGWLVVVLVLLGLRFVERLGDPSPAVRVLWYLLVAIAVGRAVHRTWSTLRRARERGGTC